MAKKRDKSQFNKATLKNLRIVGGFSQTGLAKKIGVNRMSVFRWEHLDFEHVPSDANLSKLAKVLKCNIDDLFGEYDLDFRESSTETIQAIFYRLAESQKPSDLRIPINIYFGLFPAPYQHDVNVSVSEAEEKDNNLLDEGDVPESMR